jgi:Terminase large subunit, T4likevirus-type, N-terminal
MTYNRPWLAPYQLTALFGPERYAIIEASTKVGKTAGGMVWLSEQAILGKAGQNFWWVSPIRDQAKVVFRRLKGALPRGVYRAHETELTLTLANGAVLGFKGADHPDALYGEDVYAAVIDEASRVKDEAWHAVRTTLTATQGPIRIIGNVKGRRNWAYHLARKAQSGSPNMAYAKLTCHDAVQAGFLSAEEVEDARHQLPDAVFRELYLAEPSDDAGNPFGLTAIRACLAPLSPMRPVAWGWDLAKAVDWTVGIGLDWQGGVARIERFQRPWEETIAAIVQTDAKLALVDSTGVGDPVLEAVQRRGRTAGGQVKGFKFTAASKQQRMEGLAVAIQQQQIHFPAGVIVDELEAFEYAYTRTGVHYTAPSGLHDDAVCALALAWAALSRVASMPSLEPGARFPLYY